MAVNESIAGTYHTKQICQRALWSIKLSIQALVQFNLPDSVSGNLKSTYVSSEQAGKISLLRGIGKVLSAA